MSAGPFVAGLKVLWKCFLRFSSFAWQIGTLQLIAIHLITLHNILEYMQIAILQTEAADFVKINICVILKTFGHDCRSLVQRSDIGLWFSSIVEKSIYIQNRATRDRLQRYL